MPACAAPAAQLIPDPWLHKDAAAQKKERLLTPTLEPQTRTDIGLLYLRFFVWEGSWQEPYALVSLDAGVSRNLSTIPRSYAIMYHG